jgi:hypothetical protein
MDKYELVVLRGWSIRKVISGVYFFEPQLLSGDFYPLKHCMGENDV